MRPAPRIEGVLVADGAMGTRLRALGLSAGVAGETWNVANPQLVARVHAEDLAAGARVLVTNSFQGSGAGLARAGCAADPFELARAAAQLAREAGGEDALVLGSVGPVLAPGDAPELLAGAVRPQLAGLLAGGVDGIVLETCAGASEPARVLELLRDEVPGAFAGVSFVVDGRGGGERLLGGELLEEALARVLDAGARFAGINCGLELYPERAIDFAARLRRATDLPLYVRPNAGAPERAGTTLRHPVTPRRFARCLAPLAELAPIVLGGCCGTGPEHVRALASELARGGHSPKG